MPVVGVITPEAHAAVQATRNRRVGLLATQATVASGRYEELVHALDAGVDVHRRRVPAARAADRERRPFGEETVEAVREYAEPLKAAGVDTVILGCTHYPLIRPIFQRVFGRDVTLVFSAEETAREVAETLARKGIENDAGARGRATASSRPATRELFRAMGARFLQLPIAEVEQVARRASSRGGRVSREDGRRPDELRPLDSSPTSSSSRTARCSVPQGKTSVLCTATIEEGVPRWLCGSGRGWMTAEYSLLPASTGERTAREARARQAGRPHGRDPAPDRPRAPRGRRLRGARRADALARLRRPPGRRRHALRGDLRRVRRGARARSTASASPGARRIGRRGLGRHRRRRAAARPRLLRGLDAPTST